jgi:UDP-3-O-[3-hydroxymyristoyl] glucosamine N-acyltransferase
VSVTLDVIVQALGGTLHGRGDILVESIAPLELAQSNQISFLSNPLYADQLHSTQAACVILSSAHLERAKQRPELALIVCDKPYLYFAQLTQFWRTLHPVNDPSEPLIHPSAVVHPSALVHPSVRIGPKCVIQAGVHIGPESWLKANVVVEHGCKIGSHCIIHPGAVIGADGFGFAPSAAGWLKIEQLGSVVIGNHVEIGANTCIDRGALGDTVIEDGVKLDNFIQIAHNVRIGAHTAMAAFVGVSGSTKIGAHCTVAGGAGFVGHIEIADRVNIGAKAVITRSITQAGDYGGYYPFDVDAVWKKNAAILRQLSSLREKVKSLLGASKP